MTYSLLRQKNKNCIPTISTPNHHSQHIATTSIIILNFKASKILPTVVKEYMCFLKEGKSDQADRCIKSRTIIMVIYFVLSIYTCEQ